MQILSADNINPNVGGSVTLPIFRPTIRPPGHGYLFQPLLPILAEQPQVLKTRRCNLMHQDYTLLSLTVSNASGSDTETKTDYILCTLIQLLIWI